MTNSTRGRGRPPVPYKTKVVRVPVALLSLVNAEIAKYKARIEQKQAGDK